jgi:hypothetical protein
LLEQTELTFFIVKPALYNVLHTVARDTSTPHVEEITSCSSSRNISGTCVIVPRRNCKFDSVTSMNEKCVNYLHIKVAQTFLALLLALSNLNCAISLEVLEDLLHRMKQYAGIDGYFFFTEMRGQADDDPMNFSRNFGPPMSGDPLNSVP